MGYFRVQGCRSYRVVGHLALWFYGSLAMPAALTWQILILEQIRMLGALQQTKVVDALLKEAAPSDHSWLQAANKSVQRLDHLSQGRRGYEPYGSAARTSSQRLSATRGWVGSHIRPFKKLAAPQFTALGRCLPSKARHRTNDAIQTVGVVRSSGRSFSF